MLTPTEPPSDAATATRRPLWRSPSVLAALFMTLVGLALWWRAPAHARAEAEATGASLPRSQLVRPSPATPAAPAAAGKPLVGKDAPLLFRFGAAYLGGFGVGWVWRKSMKLAFWLGGGLLGLIAAAKYFGIGGGDWQAIEAQVAEGMTWVQQQAGVWRERLAGYLPSGVASLIGLWRGMRWK